MSIQKWLRIVFPEIQLFDFVKAQGFKGNKQKSFIPSQTSMEANGPSPIFTQQNPSTLPQTSGAMKEVVHDASKAIKNLTLTKTNQDLDMIFDEIKRELNI